MAEASSSDVDAWPENNNILQSANTRFTVIASSIPLIPGNCTSVAKRLQFDHLVPVGVGGTVWAEATLDRIEGRRLVFTLSVSESAGLVAAGKLIRVVVDRDVFLANVR